MAWSRARRRAPECAAPRRTTWRRTTGFNSRVQHPNGDLRQPCATSTCMAALGGNRRIQRTMLVYERRFADPSPRRSQGPGEGFTSIRAGRVVDVHVSGGDAWRRCGPNRAGADGRVGGLGARRPSDRVLSADDCLRRPQGGIRERAGAVADQPSYNGAPVVRADPSSVHVMCALPRGRTAREDSGRWTADR